MSHWTKNILEGKDVEIDNVLVGEILKMDDDDVQIAWGGQAARHHCRRLCVF